MIRLIALLLLFFVNLSMTAQSFDKRYTSHLSNNGIISFIRPKQLSVKTNLDKFEYDMTYLSGHDSITINCSLYVKNEALVKELNIKSGERELKGEKVAVIYRDVTTKGYVLRVTSRFPFSDIKTCFENSTPFEFYAVMTDGSQCTATYRASKWEKEQQMITRIFKTINY